MKRLLIRHILSNILVLALALTWLPAGASAADDYPNTWVNTGDHCKDIIGVAETQLGFVETNGDYVKYNEWFFGNTTDTARWCAVFISWCAAQAGIPESIIPKNGYARGWTAETMSTNPFGGTAFTIDQQTPQPGDILFTRTDQTMTSSSHCSLVVDVDENYIYTIEGNTGTPGGVRNRKFTRKEGYEVFNNIPYSRYYIVFATRPDYDADQVETDYYPFNDVHAPEAYYYDAVVWALENQITSGVDEKHFAPNDTCTRAQVVTFLYRAAGEPDVSGVENPFEDVGPDDYYYDAVRWGAANGIVYGADDTHFSPDATCTRAEVVSFLSRTAEKLVFDDTENPFVDVTPDDYYYDAVLWGYQNGIVYGTSTTKFSPNSTCTRAQVVTFLYRYMAEK